MLSNYQINTSYNAPQKFFAEKLAELLYHKTIDSHRVVLNNPKSSLQEVNYVITDFAHKKIKHFDKTVRPVIEEAQGFLKDDKTLLYDKIEKAYYSDLIGGVNQEEYLALFYATNLVLKGNQNYFVSLCNRIQAEIDRISGLVAPVHLHEFLELNMLTEYLATEMINSGYSKNYISKKIIPKFGARKNVSFTDVFNEVRTLGTKAPEQFDVIFRLVKKPGGTQNINLHDPQVLDSPEIDRLSRINTRALQFFSKRETHYSYLKISHEGKDFYSVVERAKKLLLPKMDILHMGFPDTKYYYEEFCLVIGANDPSRSTTQPVKFVSDGYYKNHQDIYDNLQQNIQILTSNAKIQRETTQKIISAIRHLRLGSDSDELEQIFINYWIGLEYIFSNYDIGESSIVRLKQYFINSHTLSFIKRNLFEFFKDIKRVGLESSIPNYNADLQFLKDQATYDYITTNYGTSHPLLAFKAYEYKRLLTNNKLKEAVKNHTIQLDRHLTRCYRVRNEIVHDAAIHLNIEAITGNLKYYLTFIINDIIAFLKDNPIDLNLSGTISIEDYFIYQNLRLKGIEKVGLSFAQLLDEISVTELFS